MALIQCSACDLKVVSLIQAYGSFLGRGVELSRVIILWLTKID